MRKNLLKSEYRDGASYKDPSGFVYLQNGSVYRQINPVYASSYDHFMHSGLYEKLHEKGYIISHEEVPLIHRYSINAYKIIKPYPISYLSYPYEWCFGQLKDAALLTLEIQRIALEFGMSLKDASSYNITFIQNKPVFFDTLSFEIYKMGQPWVAYRQFCSQFLAPLALAAYKDVRLLKLQYIYPAGIPLDLTRTLLPLHSYASLSMLMHLIAHSYVQQKYASETKAPSVVIPKVKLVQIVDSLTDAIAGLTLKIKKTEWSSYYTETNYSSVGTLHKMGLVKKMIRETKPKSVWDLGSNTGKYSQISALQGVFTVALDNDPLAIQYLYEECKKSTQKNILPLCIDLMNPSGDSGWAQNEHKSLMRRGPVDLILALALVHHLAISNNLPFDHIFAFFAKICSWCIIEFIPKTDSQVKRLLVTREDIFDEYTQNHFEKACASYFKIQSTTPIKDSDRVLYLLKRK